MCPDPLCEGAIISKGHAWACLTTFCHELCKNGLTDRFANQVVDSGGPKEAQVQLYSPGDVNVPSHVGTLAPPDEYN